MPLVNGKPHCVNHPLLPMTRNDGYSAVMRVTDQNGRYVFHSDQGVPLVVFFCDECGYMEHYAAAKNQAW